MSRRNASKTDEKKFTLVDGRCDAVRQFVEWAENNETDGELVERKVAATLSKVEGYLLVTITAASDRVTVSWRLNRPALAEDA